MSTVNIEDLFDKDRFPAGWLSLPIFFYFPFGLVLALVRCFIGLHTFLVACLLPKTIAMRSFILRTMCYVLGIVVHEGDTKHKNTAAKVLVMNHVTVLDHLAVDLVLPCTVPSVWDLPKVLSWCLGYKDLGVKQGRDVLIENVRKHCAESDLKILVHPEGATTNGRVGLLKFGTWPFCVGENVLPVLLDVRRFRLLNIAPSVVGSRWWSDLFWFLFSPCTIFTIRYLPPMQRSDGASDEEFSAQVSQTMAKSLNVDATNFTCADKVEFVKRILFQRQQQQQQHHATTRHTTGSNGSSLHAIMAHQVKEVLPYVPLDVIKRDLLSTNSVSLTISNILEGAIHYMPEADVVDSAPATCSSPASFSVESKIEEPLTDDQYYTALNTAASSFGKTAEERTMSYQERKRRLIEMSRRRYMQKHALS